MTRWPEPPASPEQSETSPLSALAPSRHTTLERAQQTLSTLWRTAGVDLHLYTANLCVITEERHLALILRTLDALGPAVTGRQLVLVLGRSSQDVEVSLAGHGRVLVERLITHGPAEEATERMAELLRPATDTHVWWASSTSPRPGILLELARISDQLILDTSAFNVPRDLPCPVVDLAWARAARWRELTAQLFDDPTARAHLKDIEQLTVRFSGDDARPARLFAAWFASKLGWHDLERIQVLHAHTLHLRERGDLTDLEIVGGDAPEVRFLIEADGDTVHIQVTHDLQFRAFELVMAPLDLAQGLADLMRFPEQHDDCARALALLKNAPAWK